MQQSPGRAQLAGVSMLYLADTVLTAITEVRPDVEQYVTIGSFKIKPDRRLKVLDLTRFRSVMILAPPKELEDLISLSRYAFSASIHPDSPNKYHAQVYFVQKIRDMGFDGIGYESAVHAQGSDFKVTARPAAVALGALTMAGRNNQDVMAR